MTFLIFASFLKESGFLITTDFLAPTDVATTRLIGTAIPRAHGQAITNTATAASNALSSSPVASNQTTKVITEITITDGTKYLEMLSAREANLVF